MTISFWRYSHLALAVSSFLFITLASVTGVILAVEPVSQKTQPFRSPQFNEASLATVLPVLKAHYKDITTVTVDANQFVSLTGADSTGKTVSVYVDIATGKALGEVKKQHPFFQWVTALHRSLFLHELGRLFVGITAFLLFLIAVSGLVLAVQRQRGIRHFFKKVVRDHFFQYYHVYLGRWMLAPIILISLTGTVLSLEKFGVIRNEKIVHKVDTDAIRTSPERKPAEFAVFKNTPLSQVRLVEFPFSEFPEDYFTIQLKDKEITVNQVNGDILTEKKYPWAALMLSFSMNLHTGRGSTVWAVVLGIASLSILFFIYSGFAMTLKRRKGRIQNTCKAANSKFIILVGSENGSTMRFAKAVHNSILATGTTSYIAELNSYHTFPRAEHIIVITATYGNGEAPANANKLYKLVEAHPQMQQVHFSVVGFGSHVYPDFCRFAFNVHNLLAKQSWAKALLEIHTVNDRSLREFGLWAESWSQKTGVPLVMEKEYFAIDPKEMQTISVVSKKSQLPTEPYFQLNLQPTRRAKFSSGDLLAVYPANDHRERLYSIGKIGREIRLSVRLHEGGFGSGFLHSLQPGETLPARIVPNPHFHFPQQAKEVIMISNGTGIAPFLGMLYENAGRVPCTLYCGFRNVASFEIYREFLDARMKDKDLRHLHIAYSREADRTYVKDLIQRDGYLIASALANKAVVMLCGSLSMQNDIISLLDEVCMHYNHKPASYYQSHGQVLMDCY